MRTRRDWTFLQFAMVLLNVIFIYGRGPGLPGLFWGRSCRSKRKFLRAPRLVLFARLRRVVVSTAKEFVLDHRLPNMTNLVFQLIFAATLLIGALTRSERYHKGLV